MKNLVEVITKALVDNPEGVVVTEKQEGNPFRCKGSRGQRRQKSRG